MNLPIKSALPRLIPICICAVLTTLQASLAFAACPPNALFGLPTFYPTGNYSVSVATGDFNSDGIRDLAVTNLNDNTVSILRGTGTGTFSSQTAFPAGSLPRGIAAADVNGDGILDLVVTNVGTPTISVLIGLGSGGHGNGTFATPVSYGAGFENRGVAVTDIDHDGHPDIVTAGRTSVAVLLNQQSAGMWGTFPAATLYPTPSSWGVAVADFNGDGNPDIAAGDWLDARVDIYLGDGHGTFAAGTPVTTPGGCADITTGDLNGDGVADLVAAGSTGMWVMLGHAVAGHGDGTFAVSPFAQFGDQFNDAIIADVNGDGLADILGTDTSVNQLLVLPGDGTGAFGANASYGVGTGPIGLTAFDANGDGVPEAFVVCSSSGGYSGTIAALTGLCIPPAPATIMAVKDVPHDQGGQVFVFWQASARDNATSHEITNYRVWRRDLIPPSSPARIASSLAAFDPHLHSAVLRRVVGPDGVTTITYWELMDTVPAAFLEGYAATEPTVQDSMRGSNPYTAFFIQALTADPLTFYNSAPDSGYSVDNLPPFGPHEVRGEIAESGVHLHWDPCAAADFASYRVYRGPTGDFVPDASNLLAAPADTTFMDPVTSPGYYRISAVDIHGNESATTLFDAAALLDAPNAGLPAVLRLGPAVPNPLRTSAHFSISLPRGGWVSLAVFDQQGRRLRALMDGTLPAGEHFATWDGRDDAGRAVPSGVYFLRLVAEGRSLTQRLAAIH